MKENNNTTADIVAQLSIVINSNFDKLKNQIEGLENKVDKHSDSFENLKCSTNERILRENAKNVYGTYFYN